MKVTYPLFLLYESNYHRNGFNITIFVEFRLLTAHFARIFHTFVLSRSIKKHIDFYGMRNEVHSVGLPSYRDIFCG